VVLGWYTKNCRSVVARIVNQFVEATLVGFFDVSRAVTRHWLTRPLWAAEKTSENNSRRRSGTSTPTCTPMTRRYSRLARLLLTLETVDHGQVVKYLGDRPLETAKNGLTRVGPHSRYGFGELRLKPVDEQYQESERKA